MTGPGGSVLLSQKNLRDEPISGSEAARGAHSSREAGGDNFEIVSQLNRGAGPDHSAAERSRVAELKLIAGQRAKQSTATVRHDLPCRGRALCPRTAGSVRHTHLRAPAATGRMRVPDRARWRKQTSACRAGQPGVGLPDLGPLLPVASGALHDPRRERPRAIEVCLDISGTSALSGRRTRRRRSPARIQAPLAPDRACSDRGPRRSAPNDRP